MFRVDAAADGKPSIFADRFNVDGSAGTARDLGFSDAAAFASVPVSVPIALAAAHLPVERPVQTR